MCSLSLPCRLIRIVDTVGLKLVVEQQSESILFDSLALAVSRVDGTNFRETTFSLADPNDLQVHTPPLVLFTSVYDSGVCYKRTVY